ncbi:MAG: glycosyltransferase family 4 protein, partial [candidate division NC10 bacterium]|nr:glycosyltransferase family 4 protein [candidate division NC10 bacterium]
AFDALGGVRVRRLRSARIGQFAWLIHLTAVTIVASLTRRPDLIVCGHVVAAPPALLARWLLGVPYVVFTYAYEIRRKRKRLFLGLILRRAALILTSSRFTATTVLSHGVSPGRVRILQPGVDPERFSPDPNPDALAAKPGPMTLLGVSRLDNRYKGHDMVIRALPIIKAKCPNVRYRVVGDGWLRGYLASLAKSLGVERDVQFLGEVSDAALADLYRSCDVVVQMSRESITGGGAEGFGIVCLEAGASGKPVVAGLSGGLTDAVADGLTGLLVDPHDPGGIAETILSVLQDPDLARDLGQQGRARVLREFTWDHMAEQARRLFVEAAGKAQEGRCASSS